MSFAVGANALSQLILLVGGLAPGTPLKCPHALSVCGRKMPKPNRASAACVFPRLLVFMFTTGSGKPRRRSRIVVMSLHYNMSVVSVCCISFAGVHMWCTSAVYARHLHTKR